MFSQSEILAHLRPDELAYYNSLHAPDLVERNAFLARLAISRIAASHVASGLRNLTYQTDVSVAARLDELACELERLLAKLPPPPEREVDPLGPVDPDDPEWMTDERHTLESLPDIEFPVDGEYLKDPEEEDDD